MSSFLLAWSKVTNFLTEDIPFLVQEHFLKGRPVKKLMFTPPEK